jgi:hypothetical protein
MTGVLGGVLLGARQDRFVYEAIDFGRVSTSGSIHTFSVTDGDNIKAGEDLNYLAFMMFNGAANTNSVSSFAFQGTSANILYDFVVDQTDSEHAGVTIGAHYVDNGQPDKGVVIGLSNTINAKVTGYYRFFGGRGAILTPTYIERANLSYPQTHSGISVKKDDVVIVLVCARNLAANPISATNLTEDFTYGSGEMDYSGFSTQIDADGTFSTTIDVTNEEQQYGHILLVVRKGD